MNAGECRRKAQYFLTLSRQMSRPKDRAAMVEMAALWMGRARFFQKQQQVATEYEQLAKKTDE
jgi:hypothetical protein